MSFAALAPLRRVINATVGLLAAAVCCACSPAFDWREVTNQPGYVAVFPSRPTSAARTLPLFDRSIELALTSAESGGIVFAIGHARLPAEWATSPEQRARVVGAFADALAHNMNGQIVRNDAVSLARVAQAAKEGKPGDGREIEIVGSAGQGQRRLLVRFYVLGERFYEVIVAGDPAHMPAEAVDTFMTGFRPT